MAKDEKKKTDIVETKSSLAIPEKAEDKEVVADPEPAVVATLEEFAEPAIPEIPVSFDRWFGSLGRPAHHRAGMRAFANTSGKKTIAQWAAIFAKY